ncbi:hypothetical protein BT96DRAFT_996569 [Gymnopus androsaceus JB14]|uniref:Uncharacterized protein n=1 Tax=Gymnopus androsaceus JB14 TaxID=1447944 RepID=A0A6A4HFH6_9AGAR|nr:hypothetical protein BT96DRAFT_996569 [Gymnopus androsaceus JB14]
MSQRSREAQQTFAKCKDYPLCIRLPRRPSKNDLLRESAVIGALRAMLITTYVSPPPTYPSTCHTNQPPAMRKVIFWLWFLNGLVQQWAQELDLQVSPTVTQNEVVATWGWSDGPDGPDVSSATLFFAVAKASQTITL